jgi:hypothetical protein
MPFGSITTSKPLLFHLRNSESEHNNCVPLGASTRRLGWDCTLAGCRGLSRSLGSCYRSDWRSHGRWLDPVLWFHFSRMVICSDWPTSRFTSGDIIDSTLTLSTWNRMFNSEAWFSQANHIFSCLGVTSNFEDYSRSRTILGQFRIKSFN